MILPAVRHSHAVASVVISVDAELASNRLPTQAAVHRRRTAWSHLVNLFETYDVPATWAIVGRLFDDGNRLDKPDPDSWFASGRDDVARTVWERRRTNREIRGLDLIRELVDSDPNHDIGCHSYSHPRFTSITGPLADAELTAAGAAMAEWDLEPRSFVYPFNAVAHRDLLAEHDYTCYRGTAEPAGSGSANGTRVERPGYHPLELVPEWVKQRAGWGIDRTREAVAYSLGSEPPPLVTPRVDDNGLVAIPASMPSLYRMPVRLRETIRTVSGCPLARIARLGIERAVEEDGLFHFWFHPGDFHTDGDFKSLDTVLRSVADFRDDGDLRVETMADVGARVRDDIRAVGTER